MKKDWKYIVYLAIIIGVYVAVELSAKKENDWTITFSHLEKEPYGTYALNQLLPSLLKGKAVTNSYKTLYELKDSLNEKSNLVILASDFAAEKADTKILFDFVEAGGTALISAENFSGKFADTLGLGTRDYIFNAENIFTPGDSSWISFTNTRFDSTRHYQYKKDNIHNYFSKLDSAQATVVSKNSFQKPVTICIAKGKGQLILNSTPLAFTNIYLLSNDDHEFVSNTLSYIDDKDVLRTEFYHLGRMEINTPLRFILTNEPLRWAYYITIFSILVFMIFEAKRRQRIIPIITPLSNTSLEFVSTVGNLYFQKADHKNIAEKKIQFFLEQVRTNYFLSTNQRDELFIKSLARKSGNTEDATRSLVTLIDIVLSNTQITKETLIELNSQLEKFNLNRFK